MYHLERICALLLIFTVINQACALAFHSFGEISNYWHMYSPDEYRLLE